MHMDSRVIKVAGYESEVNFDLWGCLEAAMASEALKIDVRGNMHMDSRVIKVAGFESDVNMDLWGCFETAKDSEATIIWTWSPCRPKSIGPLPSCLSYLYVGHFSLAIAMALQHTGKNLFKRTARIIMYARAPY